MYYFFEKYYQPIDGNFYYKTIAVAYNDTMAKIINDDIPYMNNRENIVCCVLYGVDFEQYKPFMYDFQHEFDSNINFYG